MAQNAFGAIPASLRPIPENILQSGEASAMGADEMPGSVPARDWTNREVVPFDGDMSRYGRDGGEHLFYEFPEGPASGAGDESGSGAQDSDEWLRKLLGELEGFVGPSERTAHESSQGQNPTDAANWSTADRDEWRARAIQGGGIPSLLGKADAYLQENPGMIASGLAGLAPGMGLATTGANWMWGRDNPNPYSGSGFRNPDTGRSLRAGEVTYGIGDPRNSQLANLGGLGHWTGAAGGGGHSSSGGGGGGLNFSSSPVSQHYASQSSGGASSGGGGGVYDEGKEWTNPDTGVTRY